MFTNGLTLFSRSLKNNRIFASPNIQTLQQLRLTRDNNTYYWSAVNSRGEIDFLVQRNDIVIPIEVKAENNLQAKSLRLFVEANPNLHGILFSISPYREQSWMTNYPLYSVEAVMQ
ncbi:MAG: DUF4143 domain-containing protein [Bacteroidales bacterium]|nr:DUF4143 domain-containing protein [Bacteroidales bacterium]